MDQDAPRAREQQSARGRIDPGVRTPELDAGLHALPERPGRRREAQARGRALNQPKEIPLDLEQQLGLDLPERCGTGTEASTPHLEPAALLVARILDGDHPPTIRQQTGVDSHGRGRAKVAKEGERPCPASGVPSPGMHPRRIHPRGPASSQVFPIAPLEQVISE